MESATDPSILEDRLYYKIGGFVYDNAKVVLIATLLLGVSLAGLISLEPRYIEGFGEGDLESVYGWDAIATGFSDENETSYEEFYILFHHPTGNTSDLEIRASMEETVKVFENNEHVSIDYPWFTNDANKSNLISTTDDSWSRIKLQVNLDRDQSKILLKETIDDLKLPEDAPEGMEKWVTGNLAIDVVFDLTLEEELIKAELISAPLTLLILLLVFGSLVAAGLPVLTGIYTVIAAVGIVTGLTYIFDDITTYANNIVSLLGIGLSVDYSLFIVNRFREELRKGRDHRTAIAMTSATAGRAIFFSAMTVMVGLMGMLFFENTGLPSLGWGGICATLVALISSVLLLPAILSLLGDRINSLKVPFSMSDVDKEDGFWSWIAESVMNRPLSVLVPAVMVLLIAGSPFLQANWGIVTYKSLSQDDESRNGLELTDEYWPENVRNTAQVVFEIEEGVDPFSEENIRVLYDFSKEILEIEHTSYVYTYAHFNFSMSQDEVVAFWDTSEDQNLTSEQAYVLNLQRSYHTENSVGDCYADCPAGF